MKNKKTWFLVFLCVAIFLAVNIHFAAAEYKGIEFRPNVKIPNTSFGNSSVTINQDSIANYIVALYRYGATFAGFVAMFMLVFAGWQWLMAAGRLDKVAQAKNTINGVLIGLALLFGSYILMSQISSRLVSFATLDVSDIDPIKGMDGVCAAAPEVTAKASCGDVIEVKNTKLGDLKCVTHTCPLQNNKKTEECVDSETGMDCPSALTSFDAKEPKCSCVPIDCDAFKADDCNQYGYVTTCNKNTCLDKDIPALSAKFTKTCKWEGNKCRNLYDIGCDKSSTCDWDGKGTWCCADRTARGDYCRVDTTKPSPPAGEGTDKCKP